jgi:hypothetical protein
MARELKDAGLDMSQTTPQRWRDRNSIPGEYWSALVDLGVTTLDELASAADKRGDPEVEGAAA